MIRMQISGGRLVCYPSGVEERLLLFRIAGVHGLEHVLAKLLLEVNDLILQRADFALELELDRPALRRGGTITSRLLGLVEERHCGALRTEGFGPCELLSVALCYIVVVAFPDVHHISHMHRTKRARTHTRVHTHIHTHSHTHTHTHTHTHNLPSSILIVHIYFY